MIDPNILNEMAETPLRKGWRAYQAEHCVVTAALRKGECGTNCCTVTFEQYYKMHDEKEAQIKAFKNPASVTQLMSEYEKEIKDLKDQVGLLEAAALHTMHRMVNPPVIIMSEKDLEEAKIIPGGIRYHPAPEQAVKKMKFDFHTFLVGVAVGILIARLTVFLVENL